MYIKRPGTHISPAQVQLMHGTFLLGIQEDIPPSEISLHPSHTSLESSFPDETMQRNHQHNYQWTR